MSVRPNVNPKEFGYVQVSKQINVPETVLFIYFDNSSLLLITILPSRILRLYFTEALNSLMLLKFFTNAITFKETQNQQNPPQPQIN